MTGRGEERRRGEGIPQWSPSSLPAGLQHLISSSPDRCCLPYLRTVGLWPGNHTWDSETPHHFILPHHLQHQQNLPLALALSPSLWDDRAPIYCISSLLLTVGWLMILGLSLSVAITTNIGIQILPRTLYVILLRAMFEFLSTEQKRVAKSVKCNCAI